MPKDAIDKQLAEMYFEKTTVNLDNRSTLTPDQFWSSMELIAVNNKAFMSVKRAA
ncbi:hypothetical protein tpqmel_0939 [Candidatus Gastranaerophilus sp. (ex Termes propinquus)]|nr:hypothetical protein tpqmel_0939 [Candidatus Gastranaerophilus sp. (ex Termes propinquus)]